MRLDLENACYAPCRSLIYVSVSTILDIEAFFLAQRKVRQPEVTPLGEGTDTG